jgi:hypothetical protein
MGSFWLRRNPGGTLLLELSTGEYLAGMLSQQNMAECSTKVLFVDALMSGALRFSNRRSGKGVDE